MKNFVSDEKITEFRDLVNSNSNFVFTTYRDKNGKNHWNLICSCMDWLTVSIRHLMNAQALDKNIDVRVMQMFSLISSIDLVSESITQLHRVFINPSTVPFAGEKKCFANRIFSNEDDNSYFKTIRASFGAHPVNLNQSSSKRFASWPFDSHLNSGELTVHLYSNEVNEPDLIMNLNSDELIEFLSIRYSYLDVISEKIKSIYTEFQHHLSKQRIQTSTEPIEQLHILRAESEKRLDNDYYNSEIDDLIMIFEAEISQPELVPLADKYKKSLEPLIEELKTNLQEMKIIDLVNSTSRSTRSELGRKLSYEIGKFNTWIHGEKYDPLIHYYLDRFNNETNFKFNFNINDSCNLLFLKLMLMLNE